MNTVPIGSFGSLALAILAWALTIFGFGGLLAFMFRAIIKSFPPEAQEQAWLNLLMASQQMPPGVLTSCSDLTSWDVYC